MNRNKEFTLEVSSDLDHEKMVVNILFSDEHIATLNCDKGINHTEIEILGRYVDEVVWTVELNKFTGILNLAFEKLKQVNEDL